MQINMWVIHISAFLPFGSMGFHLQSTLLFTGLISLFGTKGAALFSSLAAFLVDLILKIHLAVTVFYFAKKKKMKLSKG